MLSALIIDADKEATSTIEGVLASYDFAFTATHDAPEAISLARSTTPDIIFLRVELPHVSGFSVCNKLRRTDETKFIPLVMYASGVSDDVFKQHRNLKTHADQYLTLPFSNAQLVDAVRELVSLSAEASVATNVTAVPAMVLDVELQDDHDSANLTMSEFDDEFAEISEDPPSVNPDLGAETEAAFDALLDEAPHGFTDDTAPSGIDMAPQALAIERDGRPPEDEEDGMRSTPPAAPESEFRSQREVIALKGQINTRNREILGLKDELELRERSVLDAKHRNRELLTQISELEEKLLLAEERVLSAHEQAEVATRDKTTVLKREEGLKNRLEHSQRRALDLETELDSARRAVGEVESEAQARLASTERQLDEALAGRETLERTRDDLQAELDRVSGDREVAGQELEEARAAVAELGEARTRLSEELEIARAELERRVFALHEQAAAERADALEAATREHQAELEFEETRHRETLEKVRVEAADLEREARTAVEKAREQLAQIEATTHAQQQELVEERTRVQEERQRMWGELQEAKSGVDQLRGELEQTRLALEQNRTEVQRFGKELELRRDVELRAQQALAVALRVLDGGTGA